MIIAQILLRLLGFEFFDTFLGQSTQIYLHLRYNAEKNGPSRLFIVSREPGNIQRATWPSTRLSQQIHFPRSASVGRLVQQS